MSFATLGRSGVKVSRACLGTMTFGNTEWGTDDTQSRRIVDAFVDAGHNFIDTADVYNAGASEEIVGRAIAASAVTSSWPPRDTTPWEADPMTEARPVPI